MNKKMSIYGIGPIYGAFVIVSAIVMIVLSQTGQLETGKLTGTAVVTTMATLGALLMLYGILLWLPCVASKKSIDKYINNDKLCVSGVYKYVRNPIYTGLTFVFVGLLFAFHNVWLLVIPPIYYFVLTITLILTEEDWLTKKYGEEYINYEQKVNRLIPWIPKK